eukprot:TRINITY_DN105959_c0_g1_i1.p1 TRINITY_DN105959_c0_g1~~TRINITY_DN105959_c0_g1_i1.p1  ORF type:complete len:425 (+),score=32.62 TRINITY_DN105959_c0_g1_i1:53-1276(+)
MAAAPKPADEKLLKATTRGYDEYEPLDVALVKDLVLKEGANAKFVHRTEGTWGAYDQNSPLTNALKVLESSLRGKYDSDKSEYVPMPDSAAAAKEVVLFLLDQGADVNVNSASYDWRGCGSQTSALEMAMDICMGEGKEMLPLLKAVLEHGGDANTAERHDVHSMRTDGFTKTPLIYKAAHSGLIGCVEVLLGAGADPNQPYQQRMSNERGYNQDTSKTALHAACCLQSGTDSLKMAHALLKAGANINPVGTELEHRDSGVESPTDDPRDEDYESPIICVPQYFLPIHLALQRKSVQLASLLFFWGGDVKIPLRDGDEAKKTCELVEEKDWLAVSQWTPELHPYLPVDAQQVAKAMFLVRERKQFALPTEVMLIIFGYALPRCPEAAKEDDDKEAISGRPGMRIRIG